MSTEQEQRNKLEELYHSWKNMAGVYFGEFMVANGVTVDLPPEPQWKPGQVVRVSLLGGTRCMAQRSANSKWMIPGHGHGYTDDEVTDVEPVAVLTAEDVEVTADDLAARVAHGSGGAVAAATAKNLLLLIFAERGVDVR